MTGEPNLEALQFGFANAQTLQEKFGVPAIFFGLIQAGVLLAIYRRILRKERAQQAQHDAVAAQHHAQLAQLAQPAQPAEPLSEAAAE